MSARKFVKRESKPVLDGSRSDLLIAKEVEWKEIAKLCRLMSVPSKDQEALATMYRKAREEGVFDWHDHWLDNTSANHRLPYYKACAVDIESILQTGKPAFPSIWQIKEDLDPQHGMI